MKKNLLVLSLIVTSQIVFGLEKPDTLLLVNQLDKHANSISLDSTVGYQQFRFLKASVNDTRIVGMGEATHGTREFVRGTTEMMKYLIAEMGFKVIGLESPYGGTKLINRYINGDNVNLKDAIGNIGIYNLMDEEIGTFIVWLKDYNSNKTAEERVTVEGFDCQSCRYVADEMILYLQEKHSLTDGLEKGLLRLKTEFNKVPKEEKKQIVEQLKRAIAPTHPDNGANFLYQIISQSVEIANASILFSDLKRDKYMAQNVEWLYRRNPNKKMVIYAHNMHVAKASDNSTKKRMGQYIAQFHPGYFVIGTGYCYGTLGFIGSRVKQTCYNKAVRGSYDDLFGQCTSPAFYLDFKSIENSDLKTFIGNKNISRNVGSGADRYPDNAANVQHNYRQHKLSKSYDALLFFRESSPKHLFTSKD